MRNPLVAVIDDDEALCFSLADLMRSNGYRVEPFASAEKFFASSSLLSFDCVVADVHLPGMNGFKLVRRLRQQAGRPPAILITALPGRGLDDEAASAGAQCLLRKPFETDVLLDCIERSLSNERPPG